ncbi:hypothetical protein [Schaalia sp. lx-100]|uniref:hypothetical protein n=1 Tax=Schaalia sp. lx-100 TaxID=2899081 RepID=UPI001E3A6405|nr:hypothetical protein [Schaalia sp. lx-100]MCD4556663.1 hypothetical protein [Schaalia sp. lx-100]
MMTSHSPAAQQNTHFMRLTLVHMKSHVLPIIGIAAGIPFIQLAINLSFSFILRTPPQVFLTESWILIASISTFIMTYIFATSNMREIMTSGLSRWKAVGASYISTLFLLGITLIAILPLHYFEKHGPFDLSHEISLPSQLLLAVLTVITADAASRLLCLIPRFISSPLGLFFAYLAAIPLCITSIGAGITCYSLLTLEQTLNIPLFSSGYYLLGIATIVTMILGFVMSPRGHIRKIG